MHKLIEVSVFAAIGVLVFASLLIPIVDDATAINETLHNDTGNELGQLITVDNTTEYELKWDVDTPSVAEVNGEIVSLYGGSIICGGDPDFIIRFWDGSTKYIQGRDGVNDHNFTANSECTITITGGVATIVADSDTYTYTIVNAFALAKNGTYVMKSSTQNAYMLADSPINAYGVSGTDGSSIWIKMSGSIEDGVTVEPISGQTGTFSDVTISKTTVAGYVGVYALDKLTLTFTNTNTGVDTALTYNYFIVPATISAEKAIHADEPTREVLEIMPLILIAGLIIGVLGYAIYSRIE